MSSGSTWTGWLTGSTAPDEAAPEPAPEPEPAPPLKRKKKGARGSRLVKFVPAEQWDAIEEATGTARRWQALELRDRVLIRLGLYCGWRSCEMHGLNVGWVDFRAGAVKLIGKGDKERMSYPDAETLRLLEELIDTLPEAEPGSPVLLSRERNRLSTRQIRTLVTKFAAEAGIDRSGAHFLRHSAATKLYEDTGDIVLVKDFLGHADIRDTQKYAAVANSRLRAASRAIGKRNQS